MPGSFGSWDDPAAVYGPASITAALKGLGVAIGGELIESSDTADLGYVARSLYVGGGGDVSVKCVNGETVTFAAVPAGAVLPVAVLRVFASGTTATQIVGLK